MCLHDRFWCIIDVCSNPASTGLLFDSQLAVLAHVKLRKYFWPLSDFGGPAAQQEEDLLNQVKEA